MTSDLSHPHASERLPIRAVLQAGGQGQRMGDATRPKPMQPVGGVPMVERLLRQIVDAGIRQVTVITGWQGHTIEQHLRSAEGLPSDLDLSFLREGVPRGNAGALALVPRDLPVLMAFADLVTDLDFRELYRIHQTRKAEVTLATHDEQIRLRLGEVVVQGDSVEGYLEKPQKTFLIGSGIVLFAPEVLELASSDAPLGLADLITRALDAGYHVSHWRHGAPWIDANTPEDLRAAEELVPEPQSPSPHIPEAAEQLAEKIRRRQVKCGVIGLGFIGTTLVEALAQAGLTVSGFDRAPPAVSRCLDHLQRTTSGTGQIEVSGEPAVLADVDVVFVAIRVLPLPDGTFDLEPLRNAAAILRDLRRGPQLCLVASTLPPGTMQDFGAWMAAGDGDDTTLFVAHAPERLSVGHDWQTLKRTPHLVAGLDPVSTELGQLMLACVCDEVVAASTPEVTELSKLLENAFLSVGIALVGELTALAHRLGVSAREVSEVAATKPFGYFPFFPGPGVGGHCLPNDLRMLAQAVEQADLQPQLLAATAAVLETQPALVIARLAQLLLRYELALSGARVLLVGMGFKPGCADTTASPAYEVIRRLRGSGADVCYLDEQVETVSVDDAEVIRLRPEQLRAASLDAVVVLSGDRSVRVGDLADAARLVLDTGGGRIMEGFHTLHAERL
jgi:UDP-N-acetyl-D-glucosamine dehydrogenase